MTFRPLIPTSNGYYIAGHGRTEKNLLFTLRAKKSERKNKSNWQTTQTSRATRTLGVGIALIRHLAGNKGTIRTLIRTSKCSIYSRPEWKKMMLFGALLLKFGNTDLCLANTFLYFQVVCRLRAPTGQQIAERSSLGSSQSLSQYRWTPLTSDRSLI